MQINSSETWWTWPRTFGSLGLSVCNLVVFFSSMPKTVRSMNPHRKISGTWVTSYYYLHHSSSNWITIPGNSANSFWTNLSSVSPFCSANVACTNNPIRLIFLKHTLIGSTLWFKSFNYSPSKNNLQIPLSGLRPPGSGSYLFFFFSGLWLMMSFSTIPLSKFPSRTLCAQHKAASLIFFIHMTALIASLWLDTSEASFKTHVKLCLFLKAFAEHPSMKQLSLNPTVNTVGKPQLLDILLLIMLK